MNNGWLLTREDHVALTKIWEKAWDEVFEEYNKTRSKIRKDVWGKKSALPSPQEIQEKLDELLDKTKKDKEIQKILARGGPANCTYRQWHGKTASEKLAEFKKARKEAKRLSKWARDISEHARTGRAAHVIAWIVGPVVAYQQSKAIASPVMKLRERMNELVAAMRSARDGHLDDVRIILFGPDFTESTTIDHIYDSNGKLGLIPGIVQELAKDNRIYAHALWEVVMESYRRMNKTIEQAEAWQQIKQQQLDR